MKSITIKLPLRSRSVSKNLFLNMSAKNLYSFPLLLGGLLFCFSMTLFCDAIPPPHEQHFFTKETALKTAFPLANRFEERVMTFTPEVALRSERKLGWSFPEKEFHFYTAYRNDSFLGSGFVLNEIGKHYPITFLVAVSPQLEVQDIHVMIYREQIGGEVRKKRFLKQFFKKSVKDPIAVDRDIDGISGATLSSWAISAGVRKAVVLAEECLSQHGKKSGVLRQAQHVSGITP